ncbi:hypothetical protein [Rhodosalinus sp. 5P4]|uniref:hypothetical protein n=1 Tax=Rhodosalinus sp. 5P4 TaxID=3239196 RepID=UPI0035252094
MTEPAESLDLDRLCQLRGEIALKVGGDTHFRSAHQPIRVPGTVYHKGGLTRLYAHAAAWIAGADRWSEARWQDLERQLSVETPAADGEAPARPAPGGAAARRQTRRSSYMG